MTDVIREVRVPWQSKITEVRTDELRTFGIDQREIIRDFSFEDTVFLLLRGRRPDEVERTMLRAALVSTISHSITGQSTLAVMQAADCRTDFLHALIGGLSVGAGDTHLGATRAMMRELHRLDELPGLDVERYVDERLEKGERIAGFGHRFHTADPRAQELMALAEEVGFGGRHTSLGLRMQEVLRDRLGISLNVAGARALILLDLEMDPEIADLFAVLGRATMLGAAYLERLEQDRRPFQRIEVADVMGDGATG